MKIFVLDEKVNTLIVPLFLSSFIALFLALGLIITPVLFPAYADDNVTLKPVTDIRCDYYGSGQADGDSHIIVSFTHKGKCNHYQIVVLKDGVRYGSYNSESNTINLNKLDGPGEYSFTVYAVDRNGKRSAPESNSIFAGFPGINEKYTKTIGENTFNLDADIDSSASISYSGSNNNIIKVDTNGDVTPLKTGEASVFVTVMPDLNHQFMISKVDVNVENLATPELIADGHCNNATLIWDEIPHADGYIIKEHDLSNDKSNEYKIDSSDETVKILTDKSTGSEFEYSIAAYADIDGKTYTSKSSNTENITISSPLLGQATIGETGHMAHNKAGDQTGHEVVVGNYRRGGGPYNWTYVIRCKDTKKALAMANALEACCKNNNVGYDNGTGDRLTLFYAARANNWDTSSINHGVETACSQLVSACVNCSGISIKADVNSKMLSSALRSSGQFDFYSPGTDLHRGDIVISLGKNKHSAMVL